MYCKILKKLLRIFKNHFGKKPKGHVFSRILSLAGFITGMIRNRCSHLSSLGKGLLQLITAHSRAKAAKKFVYNEHITYDEYYLPYLKEFLKLFIPILNSGRGIFIVIDGSQVGKNHAALMVSLVFGRRSIPLNWYVKEGSKGHFNTKNHVDLIKKVHSQLKNVIAPEVSVTLLGDGEFDSTDLQEFCQDKSWNYVFRTACTTVFYENGDRFQPKYLAPSPGQDHLFISDVEFTEQRLKGVNFLLWHDKKYDDPLPLISNLEDARDIIYAYDRRYSVECLFKDLKSTSFKLDKTRLKSAQAISNLIMIAAFAFTLVMNFGHIYKKHPVRKYIHRLRGDRTVNSLYTFALELLVFFLEEGIDFSFDESIPTGMALFDT